MWLDGKEVLDSKQTNIFRKAPPLVVSYQFYGISDLMYQYYCIPKAVCLSVDIVKIWCFKNIYPFFTRTELDLFNINVKDNTEKLIRFWKAFLSSQCKLCKKWSKPLRKQLYQS